MKYWADNGGEGGRSVKIKFSTTVLRHQTYTYRFRHRDWTLASIINEAEASSMTPRTRVKQNNGLRGHIWRSINLSTRECKEDWFLTQTGAEKRGGIEFRPESTHNVVFVIFLTYVAAVGRDVLAD